MATPFQLLCPFRKHYNLLLSVGPPDLVLLALQFQPADNIRLCRCQPAQENVQAAVDFIDIVSCDLQCGPFKD